MTEACGVCSRPTITDLATVYCTRCKQGPLCVACREDGHPCQSPLAEIRKDRREMMSRREYQRATLRRLPPRVGVFERLTGERYTRGDEHAVSAARFYGFARTGQALMKMYADKWNERVHRLRYTQERAE